MAGGDAALVLIDELLESDAEIDVVLPRVAEVVGCAVGVETSSGEVFSACPGGMRRAGMPPLDALFRVLPDGSRVWLAGDFDGSPADRDKLLLRLSVAAKVVLSLTALTGDADSALRAAVDPRLRDEARAQALQWLGMKATTPVRTYAVYGSPGTISAFVEAVRRRSSSVHTAPIDRAHVVVARDATELDVLGVPVGMRAAYAGPAPAAGLPEAWKQARLALRFARPSPRESSHYERDEAVLVEAGHVGSEFLILADMLSPGRIAEVEAVRRLNDLVQDQGPEMLSCLETVAATDSLRKAARHVHLHHNSVAHRVERAERYLGFSFTEPYGRVRLFMLLVLRRLHESGRLLGPDSTPVGARCDPDER